MNSSAPNSPSNLEPQYRGEVRGADGYQYWTTSPEDEESADFGEMAGRAELKQTPVQAPKKRRRKSSAVVKLLLLLALAALAYFAFSAWQVYDAADTDQTQEVDAIVVFGAAQLNGEPSAVLQGRLDHAISLYEDGQADKIFTTGSNQPGDNETEGSVGADYLRSQDIPESAIVEILDGTNTYEQMTASALQISELDDVDTVLLVSDGYHNYRLLQIADEVGIDAYVSPTRLEPTINNYVREAVAVSLGRITGYRRLSSLTD